MYFRYPIWNSVIVLSIEDSTACTIAIYIKGKPITIVPRSFCGVYANIYNRLCSNGGAQHTIALVSVFILTFLRVKKNVINVQFRKFSYILGT